MRAAILGRQRVAIGAGRAAHDATLMVAGIAGGFVPGPVVGHRAFDGEHAAVVVGDDEVEWLGGIGLGHGRILILIRSVDRDRGTPHGAAPPTPPGIRVTYHGGSIRLSRGRNIEWGRPIE